ncbi:hypothetical protein B296_00009075 [Ensete ventricosum]|uniref:Uncharacterized protein n=1 Tax=Ensete ventricosum TaxID=4639 RepID=A0A427B0R6_ENSVE|nr:hypothetical protein B296_00009075 [Ensete ventricosum]
MNDGNHERRRKSGRSSTGVRPCFFDVSMRCEGNRGGGPKELTEEALEEDVKVRDAGGAADKAVTAIKLLAVSRVRDDV